MNSIQAIDLGTMEYNKAFEIQKELHQYVKDNKELDGFLLFVEHPPVFTIGTNGGKENLLHSVEEIKSMGIDIQETNRGGDITYHGPGQIIGYPILDLTKFQKDVKWYVHNIEEVIIGAIKAFGISGGRKPQYRGIWVNDLKICALGISIRKWITMHGFALNNQPNLEHFQLINPCGITEFGVTSLIEHTQSIAEQRVKKEIIKAFQDVFLCTIHPTTLEEVRIQYDH